MGAAPQTLPYGSWPSPVGSTWLVTATRGLGSVSVDGEDVYWTEGRPDEGGRQVLVRRTPDGALADVSAPPLNVRSRVHEYGGTPYVVHDGIAYVSDFTTARLHRIEVRAASGTVPLTPAGDVRYADPCADPLRGRILWVQEDHTTAAREAVNRIVAVPMEGGSPTVLAGGHDFVAAPRLSPDGARLAWITWDHPRMPWEGTDLWVADLDSSGLPGTARHVAGGPGESVLEPTWAPGGALWFSSDLSGWWNLWRWDGDGPARPVAPMEMETAGAPWVLGMQSFVHLPNGRVSVVARGAGRSALLEVDPDGRGAPRPVGTTLWLGRGLVLAEDGRILTIAASATSEPAVVAIDPETGTAEELRRASDRDVDPALVSAPEPVHFPSRGGRTAHGYLYRPRNPAVRGPDGEAPPLRVISHGGPTDGATPVLAWSVQYYTSRGIAILDVDYGGSTGYGRAYRALLDGAWGIVDVEDCVAGAQHLAALGVVDGARLTISGGSAGGFTTLAALTGTTAFAAGASHYGIGDLEALAVDTHKFESRYLDGLVGPYPQRRDLYLERSPITHADRLCTPVVLFQGDDDRVVPPAQSRRFFEAALAAGVPCAYEEFPGEGHGFRGAPAIRRALDGEMAFLGAVLGFRPAETLDPPLQIENPPGDPA